MKTIVGVLALAALAAVTPAQVLVTFDNDATGDKGTTFVSSDSALLTFSAVPGPNPNGTPTLVVDALAEAGGSRALVAGADDPTFLGFAFSGGANALSFSFGNDEPSITLEGDFAVLTLFSGTAQVGRSEVLLNRNDLVDQTISFSGATFDRATFGYAFRDNGVVTPIEIREVVDNVRFTPVPEPATMAALGFGALALLRRRRA